MNYKAILATAVALAASAFLVGCGGGGGNEVAPGSAAANDAAIAAAKEQLISRAKDPASTQFRNMRVYRASTDPTVCGEYNTKNGFGAYVGFTPFYYRPSSTFGSFATDAKDYQMYEATCSEKPSAEVDKMASDRFTEIVKNLCIPSLSKAC